MGNSRIIGWERILPELAAFFTALKMRIRNQRENGIDLVPFNLFLSGRTGTNKTEGMLTLCPMLGYSVECIDCSTLDDIAELAGVIDIRANREEGIARIIEGELLNKDVLILDEFLNARPHVVPQFRLMLQGKLKLLAKEVPIKTKCLIATANLTEDMDAGEANVLDSPTADRFAMLVHVPSFRELSAGERDAVIERRQGNGFEDLLKHTIDNAVEWYNVAEKKEEIRKSSMRYVRTVAEHLANTPFEPEGRRAQLLYQFINATYAISDKDGQDLNSNVSRILHTCLNVIKLTGQDVNFEKVSNAHREAGGFLEYTFLSEEERAIVDAPTLKEKVTCMIRYRDKIGLPTKLDVIDEVKQSDEFAVGLAFLELANSGFFNEESTQLKEVASDISKEIAVRNPPHSLPQGFETYLNQWKKRLPIASPLAINRCDGDLPSFNHLMKETESILAQWKNEVKHRE